MLFHLMQVLVLLYVLLYFSLCSFFALINIFCVEKNGSDNIDEEQSAEEDNNEESVDAENDFDNGEEDLDDLVNKGNNNTLYILLIEVYFTCDNITFYLFN